ncbi:tape measure protein [Sphingomonas carotinifaciens]|uniref:tape measure protein n=1 Tax=Sphingomonas carotinifaciens TaxID=1166323 RepID=UPI000DD57475|nr:tape measure protein [Sphingomonas carotinifaciens]
MASAVIGALRVALGLDSAEFRAGALRAQNAANGLANRIGRSFNALGNSGRALGGVLSSLSGPLALLTGAGGAAGLIAIADEAKSMTAQLKLATAASGSFAMAQQDVARIAVDTRSGLAETTNLYGSFTRTSQELERSQVEAAQATETFTKALKIGGAGTQQVQSATLQMSQALSDTSVQWEELGQILEASPRLAKVFTDSLGVTRQELKQMAESGKLSGEMLFNALNDRAITAKIDAEFQQLPVTFGEAMTLVHNAALATFGAFDDGGQFSTALANFIGRGAEGFASLAEAASAEGIHIRSTFEGLSDVFSPLLSGAQGAFAGVRQEADYTRTSIINILQAFDDLKNLYVDAENIGRRVENSLKGALNRAQRRAGAGPGSDVAMSPILARSDTAGTFARGQRRSAAQLRLDQSVRRKEAEGWIIPRNADGSVNEAGIRRRERVAAPARKPKADPDVAKYQGEIADLEKLKARASGNELKTIQSQIDKRKKIVANLQQGVSVEAARAAAGGGGGGRSADAEQKKREREAKQAAEKADRDLRRYEAAEASERDAELRARADLTVEARDRLAIEKQLRDNETAARLRAIETDKDLTDAQKARLSSLVKSTAALEEEAAQRRAQQDQQRQDLERVTAANDNQIDILSAQASLVRTTKDRAALELKILDLQFQQQRAIQEAVLASQTATAQEKAIAQARLATLDQLQALGRAQVERENQSPLARYLDTIPKTRAEMDEAMEDLSVKGLDGLIDGIATATTDFKSLGDTVTSVVNGMLADFARMALRKGLMNVLGKFMDGGSGASSAVTAAFGIGGAGSAGSAMGTPYIPSLSGARAKGGPVIGGRNYLVGELGPEVFTAPHTGRIIANDALGFERQKAVVQLVVGEGQMFEPRVAGISGDVSVETVAASNRTGALRGRQQLGGR